MVLREVKNQKKSRTAKFSLICCLMIFVLFSQTISAKTLAEYKANVELLQGKFASMTAGKVSDEFIDDIFNKVPNILPAEETIETGGASIDVNNQWLAREIVKYRNENNSDEQKTILIGINERLEAIRIKIQGLQKAEEVRATKDEEKQKLAEILNREEFSKPSEEQKSLFQRGLEWLDKLLRKDPTKDDPQQKQLPPSNFGAVVYYMQFVLYALVFGVIGFIFYKFAPFLFKKIRKREKREKKEQIILGEKISADETSISIFSEAETLAKDGNLKDAIRKGYIAFLFELNERKLIGLAKHKTNRDYLRSVRKKHGLHKNMDDMTLNYERHWYGFEDADENDWQEFKENYNEALGQK